jgi:hypothetical protein
MGIDGDVAESLIALIRSSAPSGDAAGLPEADFQGATEASSPEYPYFSANTPGKAGTFARAAEPAAPQPEDCEPVLEQPASSRLPAAANRSAARTDHVPAMAGIVVMLAAFGLSGIIRRLRG